MRWNKSEQCYTLLRYIVNNYSSASEDKWKYIFYNN